MIACGFRINDSIAFWHLSPLDSLLILSPSVFVSSRFSRAAAFIVFCADRARIAPPDPDRGHIPCASNQEIAIEYSKGKKPRRWKTRTSRPPSLPWSRSSFPAPPARTSPSTPCGPSARRRMASRKDSLPRASGNQSPKNSSKTKWSVIHPVWPL